MLRHVSKTSCTIGLWRPIATRAPGPRRAPRRATGDRPASSARCPRWTPRRCRAGAVARAVQPAWAAIGFDGRGAVLRAAQRWLVENSQRMLDTICDETGKTVDDAQVEVSVAAQSFGFWPRRRRSTSRIEAPQPVAAGVRRKVLIRYSPIGVVGVIGPWNYPLVNTFCDAVPALMAGKPDLQAVRGDATDRAARRRDDGRLRCSGRRLPGRHWLARETGEALIDNTDFIMFTGSTGTGKAVMARAAQTLTPVSLELGGKTR